MSFRVEWMLPSLPPPPSFDNLILNHKRNENQFFDRDSFYFARFLFFSFFHAPQKAQWPIWFLCCHTQRHWLFITTLLYLWQWNDGPDAIISSALFSLFSFTLLSFLLFCYMLLNLFTNTFLGDAISNHPRFYIYYMCDCVSVRSPMTLAFTASNSFHFGWRFGFFFSLLPLTDWLAEVWFFRLPTKTQMDCFLWIVFRFWCSFQSSVYGFTLVISICSTNTEKKIDFGCFCCSSLKLFCICMYVLIMSEGVQEYEEAFYTTIFFVIWFYLSL